MGLLGFLFACLFLTCLILPWVNLAKLSHRKAEIQQLRSDLERQRRELAGMLAARAGDDAVAASEMARPQSEVGPAEPEPIEPEPPVAAAVPPPLPPLPAVVPAVATEDAGAEPAGATHDWFSKIVVWVGGVALLMAGFFMVKYSIDSGWLTPLVRLWLTAAFGGLLCASGFGLSSITKIRANERVGQALSGAGVACLYFAAYAAVHLYHFLGGGPGFGCMVAVTVLAVLLSLRHGAPIALMGLLGGFLTPAFMHSDAVDSTMLFGYLFLLFCGAQLLCLRRAWWGLLFGSLLGAYLWSGAILIGNALGALNDLGGAMLFVLGVCAVNAFLVLWTGDSKGSPQAQAPLGLLRVAAWVGGVGQAFALLCLGRFAVVDALLFSVLAVGALLLAVLREKEFIWAAWLGLIAVLLAGLFNPDLGVGSWLACPLGMTLLFAGVGHWRGLKSERATVWRGLSMTALLALVPVLYWNREFVVEAVPAWAAFWLVLALVEASLLALAGEHLLRRGERAVAGDYQAFAVFLVGFGLWEYVSLAYLSHWVAVLLIASAIYWKLRDLTRVGLVTGALAGGWSLLMWDLAGEAIAYFFAEGRGDGLAPGAQDGLAVLAWLLGLGGGFVAVRLHGKAWSPEAKRLVAWWLGVATALGVVALYQSWDERIVAGAFDASVMAGGLTALFALLALGVRRLVPRWPAGRLTAALLAGVVGVRIVLLHLAGSGAEGESFFLNALLLQFGVPFAVFVGLAWLSASDPVPHVRRVYQVAAMLLGFVWSTFLVRDFYGSSALLGGHTSGTELYTYSVVWLLLAICYQAIGLLRDQPVIHVGSLVLLLVTVGKVFLVDASELEGLFRVLSFLGLGVALIGIGFFYNKVVFGRQGASADLKNVRE